MIVIVIVIALVIEIWIIVNKNTRFVWDRDLEAEEMLVSLKDCKIDIQREGKWAKVRGKIWTQH